MNLNRGRDAHRAFLDRVRELGLRFSCGSSMAHIKQSTPDSGLDIQVKVLKIIRAVPSRLKSGSDLGPRARTWAAAFLYGDREKGWLINSQKRLLHASEEDETRRRGFNSP